MLELLSVEIVVPLWFLLLLIFIMFFAIGLVFWLTEETDKLSRNK